MMFAEIAIVAALIVLNGLLAMAELASVSARPARLKVLIEQGVPGSRPALALASDPGRFLSVVQIGITLVGVLAERLHLRLPAGRSFHTAAGLVIAETGHLPEVCETADIQGWRFEVIDLDGRRIDKLLVSRIPALRRART